MPRTIVSNFEYMFVYDKKNVLEKVQNKLIYCYIKSTGVFFYFKFFIKNSLEL